MKGVQSYVGPWCNMLGEQVGWRIFWDRPGYFTDTGLTYSSRELAEQARKKFIIKDRVRDPE